MSKTFDEALKEAVAALSVLGTGKLRSAAIVKEGPRSFQDGTQQNQSGTPASTPNTTSSSTDTR